MLIFLPLPLQLGMESGDVIHNFPIVGDRIFTRLDSGLVVRILALDEDEGKTFIRAGGGHRPLVEVVETVSSLESRSA